MVHLKEVLARGEQSSQRNFNRTVVWASGRTAEVLRYASSATEVRTPAVLDGPLPVRAAWQRWWLPNALAAEDADLLWAPGGIAPSGLDIPVVTVFQNMLPFAGSERARYGWSWMRLRLIALAWLQRRSFTASNGIICLTEHAQTKLHKAVPAVRDRTTVIPHGVDRRFFEIPIRSWAAANPGQPARVLYLSIVDVYKHQHVVAEAMCLLRERGYNLQLDLVGPAYGPAFQWLDRTLRRLDPNHEVVCYRGPISHAVVHEVYAAADIFIFASTCENLPIILLEAMASGLPIACSDRLPMPQVLGDAGVYFDPEDPTSIADAVAELLDNPKRARSLGVRARARAEAYTWERCAGETYNFLASVALDRGSLGQTQSQKREGR